MDWWAPGCVLLLLLAGLGWLLRRLAAIGSAPFGMAHAGAQWSGTHVPSLGYRLAIGGTFWVLLKIATLRFRFAEPTGQSAELRALNFVLGSFKRFHQARLESIRVPFLGVITPLAADFSFRLEKVGSMDVFVLDPAAEGRAAAGNHTPTCVILYVHGGGFVSGDFGGFRGMVHQLAKHAGMPVVFPHYRLVPEYDMVDQVADVLAALRFAVEHFRVPASSVIVVADSAGGGLALLALQRLVAARAELPKRAILISPVTDLSCSGSTFMTNSQSCIFRPDVVQACMEIARTRFDAQDSAVSPLFGEFSGLPPLYFLAASTEVFVDDTRRAVARAQAAGVTTTILMGTRIPHAFPTFYFAAPECAAGLAQIASWILHG